MGNKAARDGISEFPAHGSRIIEFLGGKRVRQWIPERFQGSVPTNIKGDGALDAICGNEPGQSGIVACEETPVKLPRPIWVPTILAK